MAGGKVYPAAVRAHAGAAVAAGESVSAAARRLGIPKTTVQRWVLADGPARPDNARTREAMAALIYDTLTDLLGSVRAQLRAATDEEWLAKQSAGDIAALLGAELDRAIRLLAGFRPAQPGVDPPALDAGHEPAGMDAAAPQTRRPAP
jgi:transposase-like protein